MSKRRKKVVIFSGAGLSAESGLKTFRNHDGLWENHQVTDVATPQAWKKDPEMVLRFYNMRLQQLQNAEPNKAHLAIADLEEYYAVSVITQNIDDLHERAGSTSVIHLHGELNKAQSESNPDSVYPIEKGKIEMGDLCENGHQLRPKVVWFGEAVPMMEVAIKEAEKAEILIVIGTSLNVYPAASLIHHVPNGIPSFLIDPEIPPLNFDANWTLLAAKAGEGMPRLKEKLMKEA